MAVLRFVKQHFIGILTLVVVYVVVHYVVVHNRPPGAMTVVEAQAMDMSVSGTPVGAAPVAVETVTDALFAPTVTYTGTVQAFNDTDVYPRVTGTVTAVTVYPGQRVKAGQVVARLDSAEVASRADEAAAASRAAQHDQNISGEERNIALAQDRAARAKAAAAEGALRDARSQIAAAEAMRDSAQREQEAAQAGPADAQASISAAQADVDYWTAELAREEKLFRAGAVPREEYDREQSQAKGAQAKLAQARASVREKQAMVSAAQAKARQAEAGIASARAKADQMGAEVLGAQAEISPAETNVDLNKHHVAHKAAMAQQASAQARTAAIIAGYTEIRAAQDGVVTERVVSPGTLVQPGMPLMRIKSVDQVRLQANVAESDLAGIRAGSEVKVTSSRDPGLVIHTRVTSLFNAAEPKSRTVTVEALTPNPGGRLVPGQFIVMEIATSAPRRLLTVPLSAIVRDEDQHTSVWTVARVSKTGKQIFTCVMHPEVQEDHPGKCPKCGMDLVPSDKGGSLVARRAPVQTGAENGGRVAILSGLHPGDRVIYRGHEALKEGESVFPTDWSASGPKTIAPNSPPASPSHPAVEATPANPAGHSGMEGMQGMKGMQGMEGMRLR